MAKSAWLLRAWGRDLETVTAIRPPDAREQDAFVACWWFADEADREAFLLAWPTGLSVVRDKVTGGPDWLGETIEPDKVTIAEVVLALPDGRRGEFSIEFGYGYPAHAAEGMLTDGNYSCDCNKRLFLARKCGIDPHYEEDETDNPCGDTIILERLVIRKEAR